MSSDITELSVRYKIIYEMYRILADPSYYAANDSTENVESLEQDATQLGWGYTVEKFIYGAAVVVGIFACVYTTNRFLRTWRTNFVIAARLLSYKVSLSVADILILFFYAPTQFAWITTYWWYGGNVMCKLFKFASTFAFHLTGNMQVLIAFDRLYIMTRISHANPRGHVNYNTNMCLGIAWILAFVCAFPQLFIFHQGETFRGNTQCIAVWIVARNTYQEEQDYHMYYDHIKQLIDVRDERVMYPNGTLKPEFIKFDSLPEPNRDRREIEREYHKMEKLEQIYNGIHLSTICLLPYILELFSYLCIISLLNSAKRGQFLGFRDLLKKMFFNIPLVRCYMFIRKRLKEACMKKKLAMPRHVRLTKAKSRSEANSPTAHERFMGFQTGRLCVIREEETMEECLIPLEKQDRDAPFISNGDTKTNGHCQNENGSNGINGSNGAPYEKKNVCATAKGQHNIMHYRHSEGSVLQPTNIRMPKPEFLSHATTNNNIPKISSEDHETNGSVATTTGADGRRASAPEIGEKTVCDPGKQPWVFTVMRARRNCKKKAFYMLSFNLIFWLPYCMHGVMSSVMVIGDFQNFNFVSALVCFNAVSNILL